uniref:Antigen WC1.1-like n=1 Tax=Castor canadensis TaxID=51338 RepID=A0A8B7W7V2_CASCN|nr:antigen WC1.1-like [Castor canadensis]
MTTYRCCFVLELVFVLLTVLTAAQDSAQLQLVDGENHCSGRVEILHEGIWGTVCRNNWEWRDSQVVCRQLGCGEVIHGTTYIQSDSRPIWLENMNCRGGESHLWNCPSSGWGPHDCSQQEVVGVLCSGFVRLAGEHGLCSGRVEVNSGGDWILVSYGNFMLPTAEVICTELWCGKPVSVLRNVSRYSQSPELRLVGGRSHCAGRIEILHQDTWGTICDDSWDLKDAQVVCRQLGCGVALNAMTSAHFGAGSGPIWLSEVNCIGKESHVWKCPSLGWHKSFCDHNEDAGVICSGFVRLAGGGGLCSGVVEVNSGGNWTQVSDGNFIFANARVICAELGCGKAASVLGDVAFKSANGQVWAEEFQCRGQEQRLWFCPRVPCPGGSCQPSGAVHIVCSEYAEVRLMNNGTSRCEGQVELNTSQGWRTLCASHWNMANANVVCRQLGCGIAISTPKGAYYLERGEEIWKDRFHCSGSESFLWSCPVTALGVPACAPGNTASVVCSGSQTQLRPQCNDSAGSAASEGSASNCSDSRELRLVEAGGRCAGRVEILQQGSWGTICDDSWDLSDAHVVCRQLGCGVALRALGSAHFGAGSGPIWLDDVNCTGVESHVWKCPSQGWGQHDCRHKEDAGVICSEFLALRMVSEDQECAGWLEIFYNQTWGSVCRTPMDVTTLSVICRQLGCGESGSVNFSVVPRDGSRPQWVDGIQCRKTDTSFWQCPSEPWKHRSCSSRDEAYVMCADREKLRLRGGDSECTGRVEVWHEGTWGTVCDDTWSLAEAAVVCRQLGCGSALEALREAAFGPGNGSIWLDEVRCRGSESSLWDCAAAPWRQSNCKHEEDAGVRCSGTKSVLAPVPGIFSIPGILCVILGALLLLVLVIMGIQMHSWRAQLQALHSFEDAAAEALYQEIDYLMKSEENILDSPEPPGQHVDATGNGYDDVEELPALEMSTFPGMSEKYLSSEEGSGDRYSQTAISLQSPREAGHCSMGEKEFTLILRSEDPQYDDIELDAM